ncbi:MAG: P-type conjugative transfer protein VirB9 [Rickettsiales bacterium]
MKKNIYILIILIINFYNIIFAEIHPRKFGSDSRIQVVNYTKNNVIKIIGYYGLQTTIQLGPDEEVVTMSIGDTTSWQVHNVNNVVFIKPIELDANTNMTMITNKRIYFFELDAKELTEQNKNTVAYNIRFIYPDEDIHQEKIISNTSLKEPDLTEPEKYNLNYYVSGDQDIAPVKIFDDGKLTFIQFSYQVKDLPAIFAVDEDLREHIINYTVSSKTNNLIIVEQVFDKLSLRLGKKILCIYNEGYANFTKKKYSKEK